MMRVKDLVSFEAAFLLFFFIAAYKGSPFLEHINERWDLTVVSIAVGLVCASLSCLLGLRRLQLSNAVVNLTACFVLFVAFAAVSYHFTKSGEVASVKIQKLIIINSWALFAPLLISTREQVQRLVRLIIACGLLLCVAGAVEVVFGSATKVGILGHDHYHAVGRYGGVAFVMAIAVYLGDKARVRHKGLLPVAGCILGAVLLSMTRQAIVGIIVAIAAVGLLKVRKEGLAKNAGRFTMAVIGVAVVLITLCIHLTDNVDVDRFQRRMSILYGEKSQLQESPRVLIYQASFEVWRTSPLVGTGFGSFQEKSGLPFRQSHNFVLELLCELGVLGLAIYCVLLWIPFMAVWRQSRRINLDGTALALIAGWVFYLSCALFSGDITDNRNVLSLAALITVHFTTNNLRCAANRKQLVAMRGSAIRKNMVGVVR